MDAVKLQNSHLIQLMLFLRGEDSGHLSAGHERVDVDQQKVVTEHLGSVNVQDGVLTE